MDDQLMAGARPPRGSTDRSFGLVFAVVFLVVSLQPLWHGAAVRGWALAVSAGFLVLALFAPRTLHSANLLWQRVGALLHSITSPVALGIVFFGAILPTGIVMRIARKRPLRLSFDKAATSYWILRDPPGPAAGSMKNQF